MSAENARPTAEKGAHPACGCAPDCAERIACQKVGEVGHFACGWCGDHEQANHIRLCLTRPIPPAATERGQS